MGVFGCLVCGLLQSISLEPFEDPRNKTLSCDADWGNVRHGKGARFSAFLPLLRELPWGEINRVADIGANRGDFVLWLEREHPGKTIYALEPDGAVTGAYDTRFAITTLHQRFEESELPECDLIYKVHTLEHAASAKAMLLGCHKMLAPGGRLVLEVPNVAAISDPNNVEEFFIDKHRFHLGHEVLTRMVRACGFDVVQDRSNFFNLTLLLRKIASEHTAIDTSGEPVYHRTLLAGYARTLEANRTKLRRLVAQKLGPLAERQRVGYWGAGRIFSALCRYGGLLPNEVYCLVDSHLASIVKETEGVEIQQPERLKFLDPQVLVILARTSCEAMKQAARDLGIANVVTFAELLEQVT